MLINFPVIQRGTRSDLRTGVHFRLVKVLPSVGSRDTTNYYDKTFVRTIALSKVLGKISAFSVTHSMPEFNCCFQVRAIGRRANITDNNFLKILEDLEQPSLCSSLALENIEERRGGLGHELSGGIRCATMDWSGGCYKRCVSATR